MATSLFKKILIANRAEIAVRIIRSCKELGIQTVAVYSKVDTASNHVKFADEAYLIGEEPMSYLNCEKIIKIAKKAGADAIHPGYGFLSENTEFVELCEKEKIVFIGPDKEVMHCMGNKLTARKAMEKAHIPIIPGTLKPIRNAGEAKKTAKDIGYPVLLKPADGGGGKGMMLVHKDSEVTEAFEAAQRISKRAFGSDQIYIEKYLEKPRHIEVQILADKNGNTVHLYERECSVQRRHQKIIEETPSPFLNDAIRQKICETAVKAAQSIGYINAGTIEFIVDKNHNFYFMEMNTRLQVEHPLTEWVTGVDLVKEQIKIACGEKLSFKQKDIPQRGHSIECRIYAENPEENFLPSPGKIIYLEIPEGPFIRNDASIYAGYEVPLFYDPMIAKVSVWAKDREGAISKMKFALSQSKILGIRTTESFLISLLENKDFVSGSYDTHLVQKHLGKKIAKKGFEEKEIHAALIASTIHAYEVSSIKPLLSESKTSPWLLQARQEGIRNDL
ncbi:MAG: acetyl-CoA carboxylase biotin carboxylase subunit [Deltaproteobacteria bacterium]|nr:acetyl-CoA carboxylase biotin carboxylase subunit [Deltaproteobacteria bacterium]